MDQIRGTITGRLVDGAGNPIASEWVTVTIGDETYRVFTDADGRFTLPGVIPGENLTVEQVMAATDYVIPALELIAARSYRVDPETGYTRTVFDTIADNAANAGYILGDSKVDPAHVDLPWAGAMLYLNGGIEETGLAGGVMGHPAHGICWVCKRFAPHGIGLEPGQVVLAGSFTRPVVVRPGDNIRADYGPLGTIEVNFV